MSKPINIRSRKLSFLGFSNRVRSINHHQDDPENVLLDTEMEKVFDKASKSLSRTTSYNVQNDSGKFDVSHLTRDRNDVPIPMSSLNEEGGHSYEQQRKKFFIESAPTSAVWPINDYSLEQGGGGGVGGGGGGGGGGGVGVGVIGGNNDISKRIQEHGNDEHKNDEPQEHSPLISRRAEFSAGDHSDSSFDERRVQFNNQKYETNISFKPLHQQQPTSPDGVGEENDRFEERKRRKSRHQYYRTRKLSHQEGSQRKVSESESTTGDHVQRKVSVQPEDFTLEEADINELISHRSDDQRGLRRSKIHSSIKLKKHSQNHSYLQPDGIGFKIYEPIIKKRFDHSPHEIFVQLDELCGSGKDREWKETARWIKYEEDLEEGSDRWGRPHVASLSFHSLINLRRCLETGVVLLDLEERDLPGVAYRVVEQMVIADLITADDKAIVMRALLLKHRHVNEHHLPHGFSFHKKKNCSTISLQTLNSQSLNTDDKRPRILPSNEINGNRSKNDLRVDHKNDDFSIYSSSQEDLKKLMNDTIFRRIPQGAEATTVLVGSVEFLEKPTIAFIRLGEGILMPSITEVPIPVRFMFILMGPKLMDLDYHEVGRSIATLMANEHFHDIAYKADDRKELLSAINEFLDDSIVLPPGNWDRNDLLPFEELKAKRDWIKTRKAKALLMQDKIKQKEIEEEAIRLLKSEGKEPEEKKKPRKGPLEKTNRLWGGLLNDIKRRYPMYKSDILDGLNTETLAAATFMFFANLSTAITFGGLMSEKTHNRIGISETLLACSIVGCIFHTFAGQPLVIIGTTGPLLLFDEALFQFCQSQNVEFLSVRFYIGIWLIIIGLTVSAFEGSVYVRLLTRFTQEIFSALITLIYIVETFMKLVIIYQRHPLSASSYSRTSELLPSAEALIGNFVDDYDDTSFGNFTELPLNVTNILHNITSNISNIPLMDNDRENRPRNQPNTALFCTFLTLGTFAVAYYLKLFRNSHFLGRNARRALGDFGVPIAIALFVGVDYLIKGVYTEKLTVPEGLTPSLPGRDWLVSIDGVNEYIPFLAIIPAILVYILIFMETHISELIVDKPERGLKKGSGLHFDIVLLCFLNSICGALGMPWHCAATVRSVAHVSAVTIMSRTHAPGESPRIIDVKEQRVSGLFVSIMVGLSVLMTPLLRLIPMAVLFGVFLYMGIASMTGVQLFERITLYFMPTKHHPPTPYVKRLPTWKMHAFTTIQIFCLTTLWIVKSSIISLAFPFFLILMIPLRFQLSRFYTLKEINALDGTQAKIEADDEPDFYEQAGIVA